LPSNPATLHTSGRQIPTLSGRNDNTGWPRRLERRSLSALCPSEASFLVTLANFGSRASIRGHSPLPSYPACHSLPFGQIKAASSTCMTALCSSWLSLEKIGCRDAIHPLRKFRRDGSVDKRCRCYETGVKSWGLATSPPPKTIRRGAPNSLQTVLCSNGCTRQIDAETTAWKAGARGQRPPSPRRLGSAATSVSGK
jgi:hypothetical protein